MERGTPWHTVNRDAVRGSGSRYIPPTDAVWHIRSTLVPAMHFQ